MMTLVGLRNRFSFLKDIYGESEARPITNLCLMSLFSCSKAELLSMREIVLTEEQSKRAEGMVARLAEGEPVQYVIGECEFYGRIFSVDGSVLIPRPETEELVEWISSDWKTKAGSLLDIGTGTGCIAVSLAAETCLNCSAVDISADALNVASANADRNNCSVGFIESDILNRSCWENFGFYDVVVSNPPYIKECEKCDMHKNVLSFEPHGALFVPDSDPLLFYRSIAEFSLLHLKPGGMLYFEINRQFGRETVCLLEQMGYADVSLRKDLFGNDRMVRALKRL